MSTSFPDHLPASIQHLIEFAISYLHPQQIILFGSQARGDFKKSSDYDLAFLLNPNTDNEWLRFLSEVEEQPITLRRTDLINLAHADFELKKSIEKEGILIYDANK